MNTELVAANPGSQELLLLAGVLVLWLLSHGWKAGARVTRGVVNCTQFSHCFSRARVLPVILSRVPSSETDCVALQLLAQSLHHRKELSLREMEAEVG